MTGHGSCGCCPRSRPTRKTKKPTSPRWFLLGLVGFFVFRVGLDRGQHPQLPWPVIHEAWPNNEFARGDSERLRNPELEGIGRIQVPAIGADQVLSRFVSDV